MSGLNRNPLNPGPLIVLLDGTIGKNLLLEPADLIFQGEPKRKFLINAPAQTAGALVLVRGRSRRIGSYAANARS